MNRRTLTALVATVALGASALGTAVSASTARAVHRGPALIEEATTGVTFSDDFNPYDPNSLAVGMNMRSLLYEPLVEFDALNPTASGTHDWLATGYTFLDAGKALRLTVRRGVRFSNGSAFGPQDVAATFTAMMNPKADTPGDPTQVAAPTVSGDTVTLHFASAQYTNLWAILGSTYIMPASVAKQVAADPTMAITNPVGTGPFMLAHHGYTSSLVTFVPNPHYWGGNCTLCRPGGQPPESKIEIPSISTNTAASDALASGQLDWAGNDIPNVYADYVNLNPETNHVWFAPGNTVVLWFNLKSKSATGIQDAAVRRAVSYGINRNALALLGESGYEQPASSSSGLILPNQHAYLKPHGSLVGDLSTSGNVPDPATAKADGLAAGDNVYDLLTRGGWKPPATSRYDSKTGTYSSGGNCNGSGKANCWTKGGQIIQFSVYDPVPFTDYWEDATLISQELQALGMDVTTKPAQGYSDWNSTLTSNPSGWQTALHWGQGGNIPYVQYEDWLDSSSANSAAHYTGFGSQAISLLKQYAGTNPSATGRLYPIVQKLENIMSSQVPEAPVLYGADWNVYSSAKYTGWPDASNPYMDPSPNDPELPYILMMLRPVKS